MNILTSFFFRKFAIPRFNPSRNYVFTFNNSQDRLPRLGDNVRYICWQPETGENGTPHLQGYIELKQPMRIPAAAAATGLTHATLLPRRGTRDQARDYCRKPASGGAKVTGPFQELGTWRTAQGKRTDLDDVAAAIRAGTELRDLVEEYTSTFIRYPNGITRALAILQPSPPRSAPLVLILYGDTGTGKSRACAQVYPEAYWYPRPQNGHAYALGYAGQRTIIFDDFYSWVPYDLLLRICDRNSLQLNVMGGAMTCLATTIIFISNKNPSDWYPNIPSKAAFVRRSPHRLHLQGVLDQHDSIVRWIQKHITDHKAALDCSPATATRSEQ